MEFLATNYHPKFKRKCRCALRRFEYRVMGESLSSRKIRSFWLCFADPSLHQPPNGLRISHAPARATLISRESYLQKPPDLDRTGRGVGWMRLLGRGPF